MNTFRLAVPTKGSRGMRDAVSEVFARAPTFTIIDIVDEKVREVRVEKNSAAALKQGTGPIVAKNLKDLGVEAVAAGELGPGAKTLLEMNGVRIVQVEPGIKVSKAVTEALDQLLRPAPQL